jgi:hypothetical protein
VSFSASYGELPGPGLDLADVDGTDLRFLVSHRVDRRMHGETRGVRALGYVIQDQTDRGYRVDHHYRRRLDLAVEPVALGALGVDLTEMHEVRAQ